ncbi:erythrocyte membrane protein 1, PfEMP1, putative [Plasmodium reichenowi]|uniref:Erythrocyte membrane protein 1, PfEMP1, putative n=1 Tax=Plasmodium reichenowi TaxID=5854 RepID=A0A2P9DI23_PLARE|nr:erythrocyte membrane protein 1, PfEMP1, putative [Plasmodium reichenowi]
MAPGRTGTQDKDAKNMFDRIGKEVYDETVKNAGNDFRDKLKGSLQEAKFENVPSDQQTPKDACDLDHTYHTTVTVGYGNEYPCKDKADVRFSKERVNQYDNKKTKCNYGSNGKDSEAGACAPYRRLHLCDHNLENISDFDNIDNHTLLADVCMAAKYEGESLTHYHEQYQQTYPDSPSQLCTELARSFADIGDIIRGKDLYVGNNKKDKLEDNLKNIFAKIHDGLDNSIKSSYNDDRSGKYFKLREDWWTANRETVWRAITCDAGHAKYFRGTCGEGKNPSLTPSQCRCQKKDGSPDDQVPTYFDYVPQYLRWFEEWAEDFCRKKKKQLPYLKTNCRGPNASGEQIYCSGEGYDCEKTIRAKDIYAIDKKCNTCSIWCDLYKKWIEKQKEQFDKQVKKYAEEITRGRGSSSNYDGYESKFYNQLQNQNMDINAFLEKLSAEEVCTKVKEGGRIDFKNVNSDKNRDRSSSSASGTSGSNNSNKTFYHSEYCEVCPECAVKRDGNDWKEKKKNGQCEGDEIYKPNDAHIKKFNVLSFGDKRNEIKNKISTFCTGNDGERKELTEEWKCYLAEDGGACSLEKNSGQKIMKKQKSFNDFFYFWIGRLLNDSIEWRKKLKKCLNNKSEKCENKCNTNCKCYKKWVEEKKEEWNKIKEHFYKQRGFDLFTHDYVLETVLGLNELLKNIHDAYGDVKEIEHIKEMLAKKDSQGQAVVGTEKKTTIDKLLDHEKEEADLCLEIHEDEEDEGDDDDDECDDDHEEEVYVSNRCSGGTHRAMVKKVAADMHIEARKQLGRRGGRSNLKGDIKNAKINIGRTEKELTKVCDITQDHSNANVDSKKPCNNKGQKRFDIGERWKNLQQKDTTYGEVVLPPRREHMCTSNLEKLIENNVTRNGHVNDTFLVEVLHAAKSEAEDIKNKRQQNKGQNNNKSGLKDKEGICRAIRRSFADIGDIIRGKDMWDLDNGSSEMEGHLKNIFDKIKRELSAKLGGNDKYATDASPYLDLRKDWWTANRHQVWNAMKCSLKGDKIHCGAYPPFDDYIPQRLRWMTEWAEWYCKEQYGLYEDLEGKCGRCTVLEKGKNCYKETPGCAECASQCKKYTSAITPWGAQWNKMDPKYTTSYMQAEKNNSSLMGFPDADYKQVVDFLSKLHTASVAASARNKRSVDGPNRVTATTPNTPYKTTAGYIHQELGTNMGCNVQTEFCYYKNVDTSSSERKPNDKYALKYQPPEYKLACTCNTRPAPLQPPPTADPAPSQEPPAAPPKVEGKPPCDIVNKLFTTTNALKDACSQKYAGNNSRLGWKCVTTSNGSTTTGEGSSSKGGTESGGEGERAIQRHKRQVTAPPSGASGKDTAGSICVPPRRRRLYVTPLSKWAERQMGATRGVETTLNDASTEPSQTSLLRDAFIKSAAIETFFLWDRYKKEWEHKNKSQNGPLGLDGAKGGYGSSSDGLLPFRNNRANGMQAVTVVPGVGVPGVPGAIPGVGGIHGGAQGLQPLPSPGAPPPPPNGAVLPGDSLLGTGKTLGSLNDSVDSNDPSSPENQLASGTIPTPFLRQMFYTIADYRDILVHGGITGDTKDSSNSDRNIVLEARGNDQKDAMENIQKAIDEHIDSLNSNKASVNQKPGQQPSTSGLTRAQWWTAHAPSIWEAMICALTYDDNSETEPIKADGKKILERNENVYEKFFDKDTGKLKTPQNGDNDYTYDKVALKEDDTTTAKGQKEASTTSPTPLSHFAARPPFFRYLEEWGENFCGMRARLLKDVRDNCTEDGDGITKQYSGDGEACDRRGTSNKGVFGDLEGSRCAKPCSSYRKWINTKKPEFDEQQKAYSKQRQNAESNKNSEGSNNDNGVFKNLLEKCTDAATFLQKLGPCKINSEEDKTYFDVKGDIFKYEKYCGTCPEFKIDCQNGNCVGDTKTNCNGGTITAESFKDKTDCKEVVMRVSDDSATEFEDLTDCKEAHIFKGIKKDVWKCGKFCDVHVCKLKNVNGEKDNDKKILLIRALLKRWVEYFLEDYNKINAQISHCINNGKESICINGCNDKCNCVKAWITKKREEWQQIKKDYLEKNKDAGDNDIKSLVRSFLETLQSQTDVKKATGHKQVRDFEDSPECNGTANSKKSKDADKKDIIQCLLDNLNTKIRSCSTPTSGQPNQPCVDNPSPSVEYPTLDEDIYPDPTTIEKPGVCTSDTPVKPPSLTCVERAAKQLREEAESSLDKIDGSLKVKGIDFNGKCKQIIKQNVGVGVNANACDFKNTYKNSLNNMDKECEGKGMHRLKIGQQWKCEYIRKIRKHLCIPPRRKDMCTKNFQNITTRNVTNSNELLQELQKVSKNEGDDIIRKLLEQNSCDEHRICDAMKYSFADLADIIRGRDLLNENRKEKGVQQRLRNIFKNIYNGLGSNQIKSKYSDPPFYYKLRSDWWDANRRHIWNAMTCNAPKDAKLLKKNEIGSTTTSSKVNCGHNSEPPDYDYIPQPFRWMQEWSERFCKLLNKELDDFKKECEDCKTNGLSCQNGNKCTQCKKQCEKYKKLVEEWKNQMDKHSETYKNIHGKISEITSEEYFKNFIDKLKDQCNEKDSADKYLDEASHCTKYKFTESENKNSYAFENPPTAYKGKCECQVPDPLDECPEDDTKATYCDKFRKNFLCIKTYTNNLNHWSDMNVISNDKENKGVLVPPRRRELCLKNITSNLSSIKTKEHFKQKLMNSAYNEGYFLGIKYQNDYSSAMQAMKYSFGDYGDIVKGTDIMDNYFLSRLKNQLDALLRNKDGSNKISEDRKKWWNENKHQVWHAMLCGYKNCGKKIEKKDCELPKEEGTHQFLRWLVEWGKIVCKEKKIIKDSFEKHCYCSNMTEISTSEMLKNYFCEKQMKEYIKWNTFIRKLLQPLKKKYEEVKELDNNKKELSALTIEEYIEIEINEGECNLSDVEEINEKIIKDDNESYIEILKRLCPHLNIYDNIEENKDIDENIDSTPEPHSEPKEEKKKDDAETEPAPDIPPPPPPTPPPPLPPTQADEPFDPTILQTTIPFGIALALTSIAFFFMKKKSKSSIDMLRVLEIPQNDYGIPTLKSSNRYIPYASGKYRGKRYIYIEGDSGTDSGYTDHYSDITSSSESEYEELDINDIYPYKSHKYKTLIEVVLEPSKRDTQNDMPSDNTSTNKLTDNEWNQLKHDFISNMLQNEPNGIPNDYTSGNSPTNTNNTTMSHDNVDNNTHPTPSHNKLDKKPFIMSIHDRNLLSGEQYNYDMNTNPMDDIPISSKNDVYSGTDLINDALSGDHDIYDEILKRKENELFGTEHHPKRTTTNHFAKQTHNDPIVNQINLFHKWLDRHRDMCEKWDKKNKVDILNQLKEKWENETHSDDTLPSSNKTLNTDVSIQIHMDKPNQVENINLVDSNTPNPNLVENINLVDSNTPNPNLVENINLVDSNTPNPNLGENMNPNLVGNINPNPVENNINPVDSNTPNPNLVGSSTNPVDENPNLTFPSNPNPAYDNIYIDHNNEDLPSKVQIEMSVKNSKMAKEK